ncbi:hypothetical protein [Sutcliffiella rhizosphaerae]|nr:hypothetical protein [Sutcliffiella rhizosphaerae]
MFGLEIQCGEEQPAYFQNLLLQLKEITSIFDVDGNLLITNASLEAKMVKNLLTDRSILEESYALIFLETPNASPLFTDYGFMTDQHNHFVYKDMVSIFKIVSGKKEDIEMALIQFEETIIGIENNKLYIIDKDSTEYIIKVAKAYDIEVSFFDLDK